MACANVTVYPPPTTVVNVCEMVPELSTMERTPLAGVLAHGASTVALPASVHPENAVERGSHGAARGDARRGLEAPVEEGEPLAHRPRLLGSVPHHALLRLRATAAHQRQRQSQSHQCPAQFISHVMTLLVSVVLAVMACSQRVIPRPCSGPLECAPPLACRGVRRACQGGTARSTREQVGAPWGTDVGPFRATPGSTRCGTGWPLREERPERLGQPWTPRPVVEGPR